MSLLGSPQNWVDQLQLQCRPGGLFELHASGPNYTPRLRGSYERVLWRLYRRVFREAIRFFGASPDLIHAQVSVEAGYFAARLARKYDRPLVLTEHISRPELMLKTPLDRQWFLYAMRAPQCVMAVSSKQRDLLYRAGVQREIDVVPNLINTELFSPGPPRRLPPFRLAVIGSLIHRKGIHHLLEAIAMLGLNSNSMW